MKTLVKFSAGLGVFVVAGLSVAFAQSEGGVEAGMSGLSVLKWLAIAAPLGLGIAAAGCGLGQGKMVASAMDGIARNPQASGSMFVPMILGLAFIEALAIYALIFVFIFKAAFPGVAA